MKRSTHKLLRAFFVAAMAIAYIPGLGLPASADNAVNDTALLAHVGLNPDTCGTVPGVDSGVVVAQYNAAQSQLVIILSVHGALPNTTYHVNLRCIRQIGAMTTNERGTGTVRIEIPDVSSPPAPFYVDISVFGGAGAYGYGDTFIAGPFTLQ